MQIKATYRFFSLFLYVLHHKFSSSDESCDFVIMQYSCTVAFGSHVVDQLQDGERLSVFMDIFYVCWVIVLLQGYAFSYYK